MNVQLYVSGLIVSINLLHMCSKCIFNIQLHCTFRAHLFIMEVKAEKDVFRKREYRRRKREDRESLEDFMAFVAERDLELFLEFQAKRDKESSEQDRQEEESLAAQYVLDFDTSLLE